MGLSLLRVGGGLLGLALAASVAACGDVYVPPAPTPPSGQDDSARAFAAGQAALATLSRAVRTDDRRAAAALGIGPAGVPAQIVANAHTLGVRGLRLRLIDTVASARPQRYGPDAWVGSVAVSYRLPEDASPTSLSTDFVFVPGPGGSARIAATGGYGARGAIWLQDRIRVRRSAQALLIVAAGQRVTRYWPLVTRAVATVEQVAHPPRRTLVFEVPRSQAQLEADTGTAAGGDDLVAGDTATVGGDTGPRSPLHSFFNPATFRTQSRVEAQVVVTHEAALQATRAPLSAMPFWLEEGFADYVALDHAGIPLRTAAEHILAQTRRSGPPGHLPTRSDFDYNSSTGTLDQLNAAYESSWLACRYLATTWGERALVSVYDRVQRGSTLDAALRSVVGSSTAQLTSGWQHYLAALAGR